MKAVMLLVLVVLIFSGCIGAEIDPEKPEEPVKINNSLFEDCKDSGGPIVGSNPYKCAKNGIMYPDLDPPTPSSSTLV